MLLLLLPPLQEVQPAAAMPHRLLLEAVVVRGQLPADVRVAATLLLLLLLLWVGRGCLKASWHLRGWPRRGGRHQGSQLSSARVSAANCHPMNSYHVSAFITMSSELAKPAALHPSSTTLPPCCSCGLHSHVSAAACPLKAFSRSPLPQKATLLQMIPPHSPRSGVLLLPTRCRLLAPSASTNAADVLPCRALFHWPASPPLCRARESSSRVGAAGSGNATRGKEEKRPETGGHEALFKLFVVSRDGDGPQSRECVPWSDCPA